MKQSTRAAVLEAPRRFNIIDRPALAAAPGEAIVRISSTAVCHTDLSIFTGDHPGVHYPVVLGHESTGVVETIGDGVTGVKAGQHVIINPIISCGHCDSCKRGAQQLCSNAGLFGREVEGSMREYVRLPERYLHPLPDSMSLADATLIETLATVRHAQLRANIQPGESVVVLGQGTTGLLHTALAAATGANPVIAVSRTKWKLDMATRMGAHHALDISAEKAVSEVLRLTGGAGADVVIDTAGSPGALMAAIDMVRPGGRISPFAVSHECCSQFTTFPLYFKEISIIGSRALNPTDMAPSIELVASGKIDVAGFVTATYPLARVAEAFDEYERNPGKVLRIVIDSTAA
jgi:2-desacetyl-2-hydroxyethyl bacteriochlorophyllide A dehydrogenase